MKFNSAKKTDKTSFYKRSNILNAFFSYVSVGAVIIVLCKFQTLLKQNLVKKLIFYSHLVNNLAVIIRIITLSIFKSKL